VDVLRQGKSSKTPAFAEVSQAGDDSFIKLESLGYPGMDVQVYSMQTSSFLPPTLLS
jgi:hypothetical protein